MDIRAPLVRAFLATTLAPLTCGAAWAGAGAAGSAIKPAPDYALRATQASAIGAALESAPIVCSQSKIVALPIRNDADKFIGDIGDLLIDPTSGEIRYAVMEVGGFLGMGEDQRALPWAFVEIAADDADPDNKCRARARLSEAEVKAAPKAKSGQRYDGELDRRIEAVFGKDDAWAYVGEGQPSFAWLSQLDGILLHDASGQTLGTIADVVLAPQNGCVAYVVVDVATNAGGKPVAVPWSRIRFAYDRNDQLQATTMLAAARFTRAPAYDAKDAKRMSSTAWIGELTAYYDAEPFWKTARFATARKLPRRP